MQTLAEIASYIISSLGALFLTFVVLRFLLQLFRADYYNPISKTIVKITNPLLIPLRKVIPGFFGIDFAGIVLALAIQALILQVVGLLIGFGLFNLLMLLLWSVLGVVALLLNLYYWGILIMVVASWIAPHSGNPALALLHGLVEPVLAPFRKLLPSMGGLDLSPMIVLLFLHILKRYLPDIATACGMPHLLQFGF